MTEIAPPRQDEIDAFWVDARIHAKLNRLAAYWGPKPADSLQPPAAAFGGTAEVADELAELIVAGTKTATSGALWDYEAEAEELPQQGGLEIVLDGAGRPRALIEVTDVTICPFDEVDAGHARAEGEGDLSLAHWRQVHDDFFSTYAVHAHGFSQQMPLVLQRFRLLYAGPRA